jgi:hypothetical protein
VIDGSHAAGSAESVTVCDSNEMANLLTQQQIVVKVFVTFYKTGDVAWSAATTLTFRRSRRLAN